MCMFTGVVCLVLFIVAVAQPKANNIESFISEYFGSGQVKAFSDLWQKSRQSYESGIASLLKETYTPAGGTMNVYSRQTKDLQELAEGYYLTDNIVHLLLCKMFLREVPHFLDPDVSLSLANNVARVEIKLCRFFVDASYRLMRNHSDILYEGKHDPFGNSPFVLQQVHPKGLITIVAEDCHLIGHAVIILSGKTPHVGLSNFDLVNCKFSIEIYTPGVSSPPVITPYFSKAQSRKLEEMFTEPIENDLFIKLQGALVSFVNSSALFGKEYLQFRGAQKDIFKETREYMTQLVRKLNKLSIQMNQGVVKLPDLHIKWDEGKDDEKDPSEIRIHSVTMNGLDVIYASLRGGPFKMASTIVEDEIRFYRLQVRGKLFFENSVVKADHDFAVELQDVPISIQINVEQGKKVEEIEVLRWRQLVFITANFKNVHFKDISGDTLINGYLEEEVPKAVLNHLNRVLDKAIDADGEVVKFEDNKIAKESSKESEHK